MPYFKPFLTSFINTPLDDALRALLSIIYCAYYNMHRIRLFLVALVAVVALSAPCWAEEELELRGRLEVLLADNFAEQSYHYKLFLHEDDTGRVLALNPTSFGDDLAQLRNDMKATVWAQNPPSSRRQRASITDEKTEEATLNDKNTLLDVVRFELVRKIETKLFWVNSLAKFAHFSFHSTSLY